MSIGRRNQASGQTPSEVSLTGSFPDHYDDVIATLGLVLCITAATIIYRRAAKDRGPREMIEATAGQLRHALEPAVGFLGKSASDGDDPTSIDGQENENLVSAVTEPAGQD